MSFWILIIQVWRYTPRDCLTTCNKCTNVHVHTAHVHELTVCTCSYIQHTCTMYMYSMYRHTLLNYHAPNARYNVYVGRVYTDLVFIEVGDDRIIFLTILSLHELQDTMEILAMLHVHTMTDTYMYMYMYMYSVCIKKAHVQCQCFAYAGCD